RIQRRSVFCAGVRMSGNFIEFTNMAEFKRRLESLDETLHRGAVNGLHEALDDLLKRARPLAPVDIGFLRSEMRTEIDTGLMEGTLTSNAFKSGFNYAYYLHEVASKRGARAKASGTSLTWLEDAFDADIAAAIIEEE